MEDDTLDERTGLPPGVICQLCLQSMYLQFDDHFYEQLNGAAVGSSQSPVITNTFTEDLETRALNSITQHPKMWVRYVDDTFVIWPHGDTALKNYHNYQNQSIRFTIKEETENKIPFLDVLVRRDGNNTTCQHIANPTQIGTSISVCTTIPGSCEVSCNV